MQVQKHIRQHTEGPSAWAVIMLMSENRSIDLRLGGTLQCFERFFCLRRKICFEGFQILFHTSLDGVDQARRLPIFSLGVLVIRHFFYSPYPPRSNRPFL